jgi:hypothetical protein
MNAVQRLSTLSTLLVLSLTLIACQKTEDVPALAAPVAQAAAAADPLSLRLVDPAGTVLVSFKPRDLEVALGSGDKAKTLRASTHDDGKRKYARLGEGVVMEVKPGDQGFKLRDTASRLLWKVKFKDDSIKISDNEENTSPITLKIKDQRIEVSDQGKKLGEVSFDGDKSRAKVTDASGKEMWIVQTKKNSAAFGLQLATRIPETERAVLALELLARDL